MIHRKPKQAPKDPELDPHENIYTLYMGNRPWRWSMKVSFKERDLLLFSINPLPASVHNLHSSFPTRISYEFLGSRASYDTAKLKFHYVFIIWLPTSEPLQFVHAITKKGYIRYLHVSLF
jgi:hypothetical protein